MKQSFRKVVLPVSVLLLAAAARGQIVIPTGSMAQVRAGHTATLLPDGRVLVAGGNPGATTQQLSTAEIYTPGLGTFSATGSLHVARWGHSAVLLADGTVLVVGGWSSSFIFATNTAEIYDPTTGLFSFTSGPMAIARGDSPSLVRLASGRILVLGGTFEGFLGTATDLVEEYDPITKTFQVVGTLFLSRRDHGTCRLADDTILIFGGIFNCCSGGPNSLRRTTAEIYDPASDTSLPTTGMMAFPRARIPDAALLPSGQCLVVGPDVPLPVELYDPTTQLFQVTGGAATTASTRATLLSSSAEVLLSGIDGVRSFETTSESLSSIDLSFSRNLHTQTLLSDGRVLVAGGFLGGGGGTDSALLFGAGFSWPLDNPFVTQDFDCFDCVEGFRPRFHTGIDMCPAGTGCDSLLALHFDQRPRVRSVAAGEIVKIVRTEGVGETSQKWCNGMSISTSDLDKLKTKNRGMGNAVVVKHDEDLFSLYAHLDCISEAAGRLYLDAGEASASVERGFGLGNMGSSDQDERISSEFNPHLHLEIKDVSSETTELLLGRSRSGAVGYSILPAGRSDESAPYFDPMLHLHPSACFSGDVTRVFRVTSDLTRVRPGPNYDLRFNLLFSGTELVARRCRSRDSTTWYQLDLAVTRGAAQSHLLNDGIEGWVADSLLDEVESSEIAMISPNCADGQIKEPISIYSKAGGGAPIAHAWVGQMFPVLQERGSVKTPPSKCSACSRPQPNNPLGSSKTWVEISLGNIRRDVEPTERGLSSGWICSDLVERACVGDSCP